MSYQSNGIVSSGLPSLYDEGATTDATDKSLSILSAVTGKEVVKSVGPHKSAMPVRTAFFYLLFISTMLGFAYWQYNHTEIGAWVARLSAPNSTEQKPQPKQLVAKPAVVHSPAPQTKIDTALIEKVSEKTAVAQAHLPASPDSSTPHTPNTSTRASTIQTPVRPQPLLRSVSPPVQKTEAKKMAKNSTVSLAAKGSTVSAQTAQALPSSKLKPSPQATQAAEASQRATFTSAHTDPDEKLLEGMLRLMKRERHKEAAQVRAVK